MRPFYEAAPGVAPGRRLLLIAPHFPPDPAAGSLRWQKMASHFAALGWSLDVLTVLPSANKIRPESGLADLPAGTRVFGVARRPALAERLNDRLVAWYHRLSGLRRRSDPAHESNEAAVHVRQSYAQTEIRWGLRPRELERAFSAYVAVTRERRWALDAAAAGLVWLNGASYEAVVTCGPPHMVHLAGERLAAAWRLPFIMDMRDPWSLVERVPDDMASPLWFVFARRHERRTAHRASLIVCNTEPHAELLKRRYPDIEDRIITVRNGCDDDEPVPQPGERRDRFTIAYAGTIYLDRTPRPLFQAAARLVRAANLKPTDFSIEFMGLVTHHDGVSIESIAREEGIADYVRLRPPGTRAEVGTFLARATMLVSLPQDSSLAIPSKIYEYMRFPAWLLAFADPDSATEMLLRNTPADVVGLGDADAAFAVLERRYAEFRRGVLPKPLADNIEFSRREQAHRFVGAIERICGHSRASIEVAHA